MAKDWFSRAELEEQGGDDRAALKAYSCSFAMLPHPSTAYNLARAAERSGDYQLAASALHDYLTLKPTASDRTEIEERIRVLESKPPSSPTAPAEPSPAPATTAGSEPPPAPTPPAPVVRRRPRPVESNHESRMGTTEWIIAGVGAAALAAGVVFNLGARSAMNDCRELARGNNISGARDACDRGKRFAYLSYGLFGAAGAAAILDVTFILGKHQSVESLGMVLMPGGATLSASGRF
jgi:hypothetical protein